MIAYAAAAGMLVLSAGLAVAGSLKLTRSAPPGAPLGATLTRCLGALELLVAAGVASGSPLARWSAVALLGIFAMWLAVRIARGGLGTPCGCFGGGSRVSWPSLGRTAGLLGVAVLVAATPRPSLDSASWAWLAAGALALALAAVGSVAMTLAREVARLRLARGALEIEGEGPALGIPSPLFERFGPAPGPVSMAVFLSPGCDMCEALRDSIETLARELPLEVFDEQGDPLAWEVASVPGSPYAVAMDSSGIVRSKGTFNTPAQLRSVPATALYRLGAQVGHG